jgi:hypothetical protein
MEPGAKFRAETEVAISIGRAVGPEADRTAAKVAISGVAVALETAAHRAFAVADARAVDPTGLEARLALMGNSASPRRRRTITPRQSCAVAQLLGAVGEGLRRSDRILAGSLTPVPVQPGDEI